MVHLMRHASKRKFKIWMNKWSCYLPRPATRRAKPPWTFFAPSGKMCWTSFETIGHSSKNLGPSQKTFRPSWCPKLVTGLYLPASQMSWVGTLGTNLDYLAQIGPSVITMEVFPRNESDGTRFFKFHCKRIPPNGEAVGHPWLILLAYKHGNFCYHCKLCSSGYALAQHSVPLFRASPFNITDFYHYDLMHPSKISAHHWVGPRKSVSNWAPHLLTPALVTWIQICASLHHRKKMKAEPSRLIPRKPTENQKLLFEATVSIF